MTTRPPLIQLPLSLYIPSTQTLPSPISQSSKRCPPSPLSARTPYTKSPRTLSSENTGYHHKARKVSKSGKDGIEEAVKVRCTPDRVREDTLGVGKSPARRLFVDETFKVTSSPRSLAPSPPIIPTSTTPHPPQSPTRATRRPSYTIPASPVSLGSHKLRPEDQILIHDCGFTVYSDPPSQIQTINTLPRTPISKKSIHLIENDFDPSSVIPDSSGEDEEPEWNQENLLPNILFSLIGQDEPTKKSQQSQMQMKSTSFDNKGDEISNLGLEMPCTPTPSTPGSGRRIKQFEKSRLGLEIVLSPSPIGEGEFRIGKPDPKMGGVRDVIGMSRVNVDGEGKTGKERMKDELDLV